MNYRIDSSIHNERGLALIVVLWLLALISIIATQFAFSMKVETELTRNYKDEIMAYHLAKAGFHVAIMEIMNPKVESSYQQGDHLIFGHKKTEEEMENEEVLSESTANREKIPLGQGYFSYQIIDEEGKLDLNSLARNKNQRKILERLFELATNLSEDESTEVIDSIYDWFDKNDTHLAFGAEDDYYQGLDPAYHCKNGFFDTVDELLLVKGVTPEIFFGTVGDSQAAEEDSQIEGLKKNLTVWSEGRFNKFSGTPTATAARNFQKDDQEIETMQENLYDEEGNPIVKHRSSHYCIISTGYSQDGHTRRAIKVIIKTRGVGSGNPSYIIRFWNDNHLDFQENTRM